MPDKSVNKNLLIYSFIISFVSLFCEMHLTRLLSYKSWNHIIYLIIGLALLGYGIGANIAMFKKNNGEKTIPLLIILQSVFFVAVCFYIGGLKIYRFTLVHDASTLIFTYIATIIPFVIAGYALNLVFINVEKESFAVVYFADLIGAGAGIVMFFPSIEFFGVYRSIELAALCSIAVVGCLYLRKYIYVVLALCLAVGGLLFLDENKLNIPIEPDKELGIAQRLIPGRYVISYSGWYPLGKVQTVEPLDRAAELKYATLGYGTFMIPLDPPPSYHYFTNNGGAGTPAYNLSEEGLKKYGSKIKPFSTPMEFPFVLTNKPEVFVIGTGGGRDIFSSLVHGAARVTGAEINPLTFNLMSTGPLAGYTGNIYNAPNVKVHKVDGRTLVEREKRNKSKYDLIILNGVDTFSAANTGAYTFSETYIYTQEAMDGYVDLLNGNGLINLNRWHFFDYPKETLKLFIMAARALKSRGAAKPGDNLFYAEFEGWGMMLVKRSAITPGEQKALIDYLSKFPKVHILYQPYGGAQNNQFIGYIKALSSGENGEKEFIKNAPYDITPATDDKPFYFKYYKLKNAFKKRLVGDMTPWGGYYALYVQLFVLEASVAMVLLFIIFPLFKKRGNFKFVPTAFMCVYFICIGLSYLFIEITFMQKTAILFGSPIYPMGIIMSSMLASTGIGSYFIKRYLTDGQKTINALFAATLCLAIILLATVFYGDKFLARVFPAPFYLQAVIISLVSGVTGFILGFYFPAGIVLWRGLSVDYVPWAYAVNSGSTVVAAMLAVVIAQVCGFNLLFLFSLGLYILAFAAFFIFYRNLKINS